VTIDHRQARIVSSALWAAAGDALGWVTEVGLAERVRQPIEWMFRPSRFAPAVLLPAGTYSDDTQLRLAVSRATPGDGGFDVEAFAKIELPVWTSYSLGAGRGTTAAAINLANKKVEWFSNFYGKPSVGCSQGRGSDAWPSKGILRRPVSRILRRPRFGKCRSARRRALGCIRPPTDDDRRSCSCRHTARLVLDPPLAGSIRPDNACSNSE
jgi:hypothetical protein